MKCKIFKKVICYGFIYLMLNNSSVFAAQDINKQTSDEKPIKETLLISVESNMVTAVIKDENLQDIINLLGRKSGIAIKIFREVEGRITINFQKTPVEEAFQRLLNDTASYVLIYSNTGGTDNAQKNYPRLSKILVFPKSDLAVGQDDSRVKTSTASSSVSSGSATSENITNPLTDPDPEVRIAAIEALGELKDKRAISYLTDSLKDENEDVRESAIDSLAAIGNPEAFEAIMKALDDEEAYIRETAVDALAALGDKRAIQRLEDLLNDPDEDVRESVGLALKKLKQK